MDTFHKKSLGHIMHEQPYQSSLAMPAHALPAHASPIRTKRKKHKSSPIRTSPGRMSPIRTSPGRMSPGRMSPGRMSPGRASPNSHKRRKITAKRVSKKKLNSAATILKFMRQTKHIRKARFLEALCSDSGVCLAFGAYADEIKAHFGGFTAFDYVKAPIKRIGEPSENGFVNQIEYDHRGYKSYAILKSARTIDADNLLYEYVVGQYINEVNIVYPCFLETYGYYLYTDPTYWTQMQGAAPINDISILKKGLALQKNTNFAQACKSSQKLAILIQHLKDIQSLEDLSHKPEFIENELMLVLFQLYVPLAALMNEFTHYDLHMKNIYLYEPVPGKYIEYHYFVDGQDAPPVSFKSRYMLKIIDYGRSYFDNQYIGLNSKEVYENEICPEPDCNGPQGKCGSNVGFWWLKKLSTRPKAQHYISSQQRNISHDLLPLSRIKNNNAPPKLNLLTPELHTLVNKVVYTEMYGTKEKLNQGYPKKIYNVYDAMKCIKDYVVSPKFYAKNEAVNAGKYKLGDLYVYMKNIPMEFVPFS